MHAITRAGIAAGASVVASGAVGLAGGTGVRHWARNHPVPDGWYGDGRAHPNELKAGLMAMGVLAAGAGAGVGAAALGARSLGGRFTSLGSLGAGVAATAAGLAAMVVTARLG